MKQIIKDLKSRNLIFQITNENLGAILSSEKPPVYCGFDPTGLSLHLGNLLLITVLMRFQQAGFRPIVLVGGATGMIGDPSGKSSERRLLGKDEVEANVAALQTQLGKFLDFDKGSYSALIVNNFDWFNRFLFIDFLRDIGKHFSLGSMLAKEATKNRLETGISFTEFSYALMQAYDFLYLFDTFGCRIQLGGQDQWGNITAGLELIRKLRGKEAFGITFPLITTSSGNKFGKTEAGTIWLDARLTSPYQFYQYLINTGDGDVVQYLKSFTFLLISEIEDYGESVSREPQKREAQKRLAWELTKLVHGETEAGMAKNASAVLFGGEVSEISDETLEEIFPDVPKARFPMLALSQGLDLVQALLSCQAASSKGEARRLIGQGGVYVNNRKVTDSGYKLTSNDLASQHFIVIRTGKRNFFCLRFD